MLAVSDNRQAQKIFFAVQNGQGWTLQLRPPANATDSPEDVESATSLLKDGISQTTLQHFIGGGK
jgi:hypothetical protein